MHPILHGHASPQDARWLIQARSRAIFGQACILKASTASRLPLWLRARNTHGPALWLPLTPHADPNPGAPAVCDAPWVPTHTGLWTLELAVETAPGQVALVPGQVLHTLVEHANFESMRAYTLIPRVCGELSSWHLRLKDIKHMGFNAIWLLPISQMGASKSPYSTSDPMRVDSSLASKENGWEDAKAFADACGEAGLNLGVDLVLNHVAPDGRLAKKHPEWLALNAGEADGLDRSGWREGIGGPFHAWRDLVRLRMEGQSMADRTDMLHYFTEYALGWTRLAARAGSPMIRLDNAHSTPEILLEAILPVLRQDQPELSILGEFFSDTPGAADAWVWRHGIERLLATPWMEPFAQQKRRLLGFLDQVAKDTTMRHFVPLCSHDSPSAAEAYGGPLALGARYATLAILGGGCTGMVQGSEWSTPHKIEFIGPPGTYAKGEPQHEMIRHIHAILAREGALDIGATTWMDGNHGAVIGGVRPGVNGVLLVAANLDTSAGHTLHLGEFADHSWTEAYAIGCQRKGASLELAPGGVGVFKAAGVTR